MLVAFGDLFHKNIGVGNHNARVSAVFAEFDFDVSDCARDIQVARVNACLAKDSDVFLSVASVDSSILVQFTSVFDNSQFLILVIRLMILSHLLKTARA